LALLLCSKGQLSDWPKESKKESCYFID